MPFPAFLSLILLYMCKRRKGVSTRTSHFYCILCVCRECFSPEISVSAGTLHLEKRNDCQLYSADSEKLVRENDLTI